MTTRMFSIGQLLVVGALCGASIFVACGGEDSSTDGTNAGNAGISAGGLGGRAASSSGGRQAGGNAGALATGGRTGGVGGATTGQGRRTFGQGGGFGVGGRTTGAGGSTSTTTNCGMGVQDGQDCTNGTDTDCTVAFGPNAGDACTCGTDDTWTCTTAEGTGGVTGAGGDNGAGGNTGSTCTGGIQTDSPCNPDVDTTECVRSNRTCTCGADTSLWTCVPTGGEGGDTGAGGSTSTTADCGMGVRDGQDCTNGTDTDCTIATGRNAGDVCTCGTDDTWTCTTPEGTGGVTGAGGDNGAGGNTGSTCTGGVQTDSPCNPDVDTEDCVRPTRTCTCSADTSLWTCVPTGGEGGAGNEGGSTGAGGSTGTDCGMDVQDGQDCTNGDDADCTIAFGPNAGDACTCTADDTWSCGAVVGAGGTGAGGTGAGGTAAGGETAAGGTAAGGDTSSGGSAGDAGAGGDGGAAGSTSALEACADPEVVTGDTCSTRNDADCSVSGTSTTDACTCARVGGRSTWVCGVSICADTVEDGGDCVAGDADCTPSGYNENCTCTETLWVCDTIAVGG
jgi:hypothetical protein